VADANNDLEDTVQQSPRNPLLLSLRIGGHSGPLVRGSTIRCLLTWSRRGTWLPGLQADQDLSTLW